VPDVLGARSSKRLKRNDRDLSATVVETPDRFNIGPGAELQRTGINRLKRGHVTIDADRH
jgi:hypothetical protein